MSILYKTRRRTHLGFAIILACLLFGSAYGQDLPKDWDKCRCPNVTMWTDSFEAKEGETKVFKIVFEDPDDEKCDLKIGWIVSNGEIVEGQGTTQIRLKIPENAAGSSIRVVADMDQGNVNCENDQTEVIEIVAKEPQRGDP